jgi:hypothetical protein
MGDPLKHDVAEAERLAMELSRLSSHDIVPFLYTDRSKKGQLVFSTCQVLHHLNVASLLLLTHLSYVADTDSKSAFVLFDFPDVVYFVFT